VRNTAIVSTVLTDDKGASIRITDFAPRFREYDRIFCPPQLMRIIEPVADQAGNEKRGAFTTPIGIDDLDVGVDKAHQLIRKWDITDAAVHDSQKLDDILDPSNTAKDVWADSAYRSAAIERRLREKGLRSRIHRRAVRGHALSVTQKTANTTRSKVRARVEHVFGHQENSMGGKIVRTIGIARARLKIGMMNLGYNIRRLVQIERAAAAPA
jgi:Transposase DDE domain